VFAVHVAARQIKHLVTTSTQTQAHTSCFKESRMPASLSVASAALSAALKVWINMQMETSHVNE